MKEAKKEQQALEASQAKEEELEARCEDWRATLEEKEAEFERGLEAVRRAEELERYRAVEREREKWEAREQRLLQQLDELQKRQVARSRVSRSPTEEPEGAARTRRPSATAASMEVSCDRDPLTHSAGDTPTCLSSTVVRTTAGFCLPRLTTSVPASAFSTATWWPSGLGHAGAFSPSLGGGGLTSTGAWGGWGGVPGVLGGSARGTGGESVMGDRSSSVTLTGATGDGKSTGTGVLSRCSRGTVTGTTGVVASSASLGGGVAIRGVCTGMGTGLTGTSLGGTGGVPGMGGARRVTGAGSGGAGSIPGLSGATGVSGAASGMGQSLFLLLQHQGHILHCWRHALILSD